MKISMLVRATLLVVILSTWLSADLLATDMTRLIGSDCTRCHAKDIAKLEEVASSHAAELECLDCHLQHPKQPGDDFAVAECSDCHDPQQSQHYTLGSCRGCHHAHWPLQIDFSAIEGPVKQFCFSCHENPYTDAPSAHAGDLTCNQCHAEHTAVPDCLDCHQGHSDAEAAQDCLSCHAAHNPLPAIALAGMADKDCAACHAETSATLAGVDSPHTQMNCQDCHALHAQKPDCLDCHQGHSASMLSADCRACHNHHQPLPAVFTASIKAAQCVGCHEEVSTAFAGMGGKHQQALSCADCHPVHPPHEGAIPACSSCHDAADSSHFGLAACQQCHDPHRPGSVDLASLENVRPVCAGCHADVVSDIEQGASAHASELDCNQCHEKHGESPSCLNCHQGHAENAQANDCGQCHAPHRPMPVAFAAGTTGDLCASCHEQVVAELEAAGRAHKNQLGCVDCHQQHPPAENVIPTCGNCHAGSDNPHFTSDGCVNCHNPHQPIINDIGGLNGSRPVCAGCHQQIDEQLSAQASAHDRDCVSCHRLHIDKPSCLGCHQGHGDEMGRDDCALCHQPHTPLSIEFSGEPETRLCADCHAEQTSAITAQGGGHRDDLSCSSCHQGHPAAACSSCHSTHPQKGQNLPDSCFSCHMPSSQRHFTVGDCRKCHTPHAPQQLNLETIKPLAPVCISCHQQVADQFAQMPSGHSEQDCANCHSQHTKKRICLDCHDAHESSMQQQDCLLCHSAHQPQDIQLPKDVDLPRAFCNACHAEQGEALAAKGAAHQLKFASCMACHPEHAPNGQLTKLDCGECHKRVRRRHFTLENCAGCHDPHQPLQLDLSQLDELRPTCISCHNNQERLYKQYPNKHSEFDCRKCHPGEHGSKLDCQQCHKSHIPKQTQLDCLKCHPPHLPQLIKDRPRQAGPVCVSCHGQAAGKLKEQGAAHKKLACISCHWSHPPAEQNVIPPCSSCHAPTRNPHFAVASCQPCHQGHQPLGHELASAENSRAACGSCHTETAETFASFPGKHAQQECVSCHLVHGEAKMCRDCHQPHTQEMDEAACKSCHSRPHAPNQIAFAAEVPTGFCQPCHGSQVEALADQPTGHGSLGCFACHQGEHGSKLDCAACHLPPHDPGLHRKFPDCLKCHVDPHNLADWRNLESADSTATGAAAAETEESPAASDAASSEDLK